MRFKKKIVFIITIFLISNFIFLNYCYADEPTIDSGAAILMEPITGKILYEKNCYKKMYPASTTKIMTAILTLENCNLSDIATVSSSALESIPSGYVTANLQVGEQLKIEDLLYALMVKSANDTAVVLAEHISGSVEEFSKLMNNKAKELGCKNTNFVNPNGIHNENHYSTAYDLAIIAKYCMQNETFRKIVKTTSYTLPATNMYPSADRSFPNTNSLIIVNNNNRADNYYYKYATGIKTGYTSQARNCLIAGSSKDGLDFICVVLDAGLSPSGLSQRFLDTIHLFDYGYSDFALSKLKEAGNVAETIEVPKATKDTKSLNLVFESDITVVNNRNTNINEISPTIELNENLSAPISKGDKIGTIKYLIDDIEYSSNLLAETNVEKSNFLMVLVIIGLIVLIVFLMGFPLYKAKKRNKNLRNKYYRK